MNGVSRLRVCHLSDASDFEKSGECSYFVLVCVSLISTKGCELFFRMLVRGHVGDETCCPVFEECSAPLLPESSVDLSPTMLFPNPGFWIHEEALNFHVKYDGRHFEAVRVKAGDAIAVGNGKSVPRLGLVLSFDETGHIRMREFERASKHDARLLELTNTVLKVPHSSFVSLICVEFRSCGPDDLPPLTHQTAVDKFTFFCLRFANKKPFSTEQRKVFAAKSSSKSSKPPLALRALDLFAGCGGFSLGLGQSGITVTHACEWETDFIATFRHNHKHPHPIEGQTEPIIYNCDINNLLAAIRAGSEIAPRPGEIDVVVGGPPCQGFSSANQARFDFFFFFFELILSR